MRVDNNNNTIFQYVCFGSFLQIHVAWIIYVGNLQIYRRQADHGRFDDWLFNIPKGELNRFINIIIRIAVGELVEIKLNSEDGK